MFQAELQQPLQSLQLWQTHMTVLCKIPQVEAPAAMMPALSPYVARYGYPGPLVVVSEQQQQQQQQQLHSRCPCQPKHLLGLAPGVVLHV